jgi:superfamily II DNA or RNA helicase
LIGLTATPFRTAEKEQGHLKLVFKDGILHSEDLNKLITTDILSIPKFIPIETDEKFELSEYEISLIHKNSEIPINIAEKIAERKNRNHLIVKTYSKDKFEKTIVFALNQTNAVELNTLFREEGVRSEYVISGSTNSQLMINSSREENRNKIERFKNNELDILISVGILTEGVDVPDAKTVFLTRPTTSKVLMNQMIGRALRGPKIGGTKEANIVFFIDNWQDRINWTSPKELFADENAQLTNDTSKYKKNQFEIVSIRLIELFTILLDQTVESSKILEKLPNYYLIPVGWYSFSIERSIKNEESDFEEYKILVFQNQYESFMYLEKDIDMIFNMFDIDKNKFLDTNEKKQALEYIQKTYFETIFPYPEYKPEDISNLLEYYLQNNQEYAPYYTFEERDALDISIVAREIYKADSLKFKTNKIEELWGDENQKTIWKEFFSNNKNRFISILDLEIRKLTNPELFKNLELPKIEYDVKLLEDLPLNKWPEPERSILKEKVFEKAGIPKGERKGFEIDHIIPLRNKGKTVLENLRVLTRKENRMKG